MVKARVVIGTGIMSMDFMHIKYGTELRIIGENPRTYKVLLPPSDIPAFVPKEYMIAIQMNPCS